ncbi:MAG TPA: hypothetical protein VF226_02875 [Hyphomicrobiaceae bacterium]
MDFILSLIPGGSLTAIGAGIVAALLAVWRIFAAGRKAGRNEAAAKERDAYESHLQDIARANHARAGAELGGVPDSDPYNRDRH